MLAGRGDDLAAGAHAEGVGSAPVGQPDAQRVVRGREAFAPRHAVLREVEVGLQVLYARAHGEGLGLHRHALGVQRRHGVARAVTRGEHQRGAVLDVFKPPGDHVHAAHRAAIEDEPLQPGAEAHLAAEGDDLPADGLHHAREHVRADVRLGVVHHGLGRAVSGKFAQNVRDSPVVRAGVEFSVGKSSGSALAELDVALAVQLAAGAEGSDLRSARVHVRAALEHYGAQPRAGEGQRAEHARRAEARHDHRRAARREPGDLVALRRLGRRALQAHGDGVDELDGALPPRVEAAALYLQLLYGAGLDAEALGGEGVQLPLVPAGGEGEVGDGLHSSLPASAPLDHAHWRL